MNPETKIYEFLVVLDSGMPLFVAAESYAIEREYNDRLYFVTNNEIVASFNSWDHVIRADAFVHPEICDECAAEIEEEETGSGISA